MYSTYQTELEPIRTPVTTTYFCVICKKPITKNERKITKVGGFTRGTCASCVSVVRKIATDWDAGNLAIATSPFVTNSDQSLT